MAGYSWSFQRKVFFRQLAAALLVLHTATTWARVISQLFHGLASQIVSRIRISKKNGDEKYYYTIDIIVARFFKWHGKITVLILSPISQ